MPAAPVPIVALTGVLNIISAKSAETTAQNADNFQSLLNVGNTTNDGQNQSSKNDNRDQTPDPQAVAVDAPVQRLIPQKDAPKPDDTTSAPIDNSPRGSNDNVKSAPADNSPPATDNTTQDKPLGKVLSSDQTDSTNAAADTATAADNSDQQAIDDIISQEADLRDQLQKQLGKISDLLLAFIQALTGGSPTHTAATDTTGQASTQAVSGASATDPTASELALLKDIQSLVQQLQLALQPAGGQIQVDNSAQIQQLVQQRLQAQGDNQQQDQLQALLDKLSQDIIQLAALFQQTDSSGNKIDPFATANVPQVNDLKALLKSSIGQVKGQLQKLRGINEAIFSQAKQNLQSTLSQSAPASDQGATDDLFAGSAPATTIVQQAATTTTASSLQLPTVQADATPFIVQQVQTGVSGNGADNSGGNNQNNQSQPQPLAAVGATGASQAGVAAANATFARVMNQVNQGSILEQVVFHVKTAVADGSSKIHIQLEPASLGKLDIKLDVDADGKTGVMITADNKNTLDLLQRDMQGLQRALADAGLTADSGSMNFNLSQQQDNGQNNTQAAQTYQNAQPDDEGDAEINPITQSYVVNLAEGLDIKI